MPDPWPEYAQPWAVAAVAGEACLAPTLGGVAIENGSCLNGFLRRWLLRNIGARRVVGFSKEKACARVVGFVDESSTYAKRLQTLGFTLGARVEYLRAAPFGDPVQLWLRGSRIALRRNEAEALLLEYEE